MLPAKENISNHEFREVYGLRSLELSLARMSRESSLLENGMDLTMLGLKLSAGAPLTDSLKNPFSDQSDFPFSFNFPGGYPAPSELTEAKVFQTKQGTLFYMFYNFMDQKVQRLVAMKLCKLDWLYEPKIKTWVLAKELVANAKTQNVTYYNVEKRRIDKTNIELNKANLMGFKDFEALDV